MSKKKEVDESKIEGITVSRIILPANEIVEALAKKYIALRNWHEWEFDEDNASPLTICNKMADYLIDFDLIVYIMIEIFRSEHSNINIDESLFNEIEMLDNEIHIYHTP